MPTDIGKEQKRRIPPCSLNPNHIIERKPEPTLGGIREDSQHVGKRSETGLEYAGFIQPIPMAMCSECCPFAIGDLLSLLYTSWL